MSLANLTSCIYTTWVNAPSLVSTSLHFGKVQGPHGFPVAVYRINSKPNHAFGGQAFSDTSITFIVADKSNSSNVVANVASNIQSTFNRKHLNIDNNRTITPFLQMEDVGVDNENLYQITQVYNVNY